MMNEEQIIQALQTAMADHQAGKLGEAEALYRRVLAQEPENPDALHLLGVAAHQQGRHDEGADLISRAIAAEPSVADFHNNLGEALTASGQAEQAVESYRRALDLEPDRGDVLFNYGRVLGRLGRHPEAIHALRRAARLKPDLAEAHFNLGTLLAQSVPDPEGADSGKKSKPESSSHESPSRERDPVTIEAEAALREALRLRPDWFVAAFTLADLLRKRQRMAEAVTVFRRVIELRPGRGDLHNTLGICLRAQHRDAEALECFRRAIEIRDDVAPFHANLGLSLHALGRDPEAADAFRRAIALKSDRWEFHTHLGNALAHIGKFAESIVAYKESLRLKPDYPEAWNDLANSEKDLGLVEDSVASFARALEFSPSYAAIHSNLLLALHYPYAQDVHDSRRRHEEYDRRHAEALTRSAPGPVNDRDPDRRIVVGYMSGDLRVHSVAYFLQPLLAAHDHARVKVIAYADVPRPDEMSHRLRAACDEWRDISFQPDEAVTDTVRRDGIDVLVDLAGHTGANRLLVFARRPAPVQVSFLGYPFTTGVRAIRYRITDAYADPPGMTEDVYTEQLVRVEPCAWCYGPPPSSPGVAPLPALAKGFVTFGSFNSTSKVNAPTVAMWSRVLLAVPTSRLVLKARGFHETFVRERLGNFFREAGVDPSRIEMLGPDLTTPEHLEQYGRIDIGLDTYPYHGTTTTCEAMWMGVPVVTLVGRIHLARVGLSLLSSVGLGNLARETEDQYVESAVELASDLPRLAELRAGMRTRMSQSPLMNGPAYAREIERGYRSMWRQWCEGRG